MIREFDTLPITNEKKPRVGIVGEILVKFLPAANNYLAELLEKEGAEAVCPDLLDFMNYCFYNQNFKAEKLGFKKSTANAANLGIKALELSAVLPIKNLKRAVTLHHLQNRRFGKNGCTNCFYGKSNR